MSGSPSAFVYTANVGSDSIPGSVSAFSVTGDNGILTEVSGSPFSVGSPANAIATNSSGSLVYVLRNKIILQVFHRETNGQLASLSAQEQNLHEVPPRGLILEDINGQFVCLHPNGRWLYVLDGEIPNPSILVFSIVQSGSDTGNLEARLQTLDTNQNAPSVCAIFGNRLYVTLSGMVSTYTILPDGTLSLVSGLNTPLEPVSIAVHPSGKFAYVAFKNSAEVETFAVDPQNGSLAFASRVNTETSPTSNFCM